MYIIPVLEKMKTTNYVSGFLAHTIILDYGLHNELISNIRRKSRNDRVDKPRIHLAKTNIFQGFLGLKLLAIVIALQFRVRNSDLIKKGLRPK